MEARFYFHSSGVGVDLNGLQIPRGKVDPLGKDYCKLFPAIFFLHLKHMLAERQYDRIQFRRGTDKTRNQKARR